MDCDTYALDTTLERLKSPPGKVEGPRLRSFSKYLSPGTHAATADKKHYDKDGVIW